MSHDIFSGEDLLREQIQEHYSGLRLSSVIGFGGCFVSLYVLWSTGITSYQSGLLIWIACAGLLATARIAIFYVFDRHMARLDDRDETLLPKPWARLEIAFCGLYGLLFGVLFEMVYDVSDPSGFAQAQLVIILNFSTLTVIGFMARYVPCFFGFLFCSVPFVVIKLLSAFSLMSMMLLSVYLLVVFFSTNFILRLNKSLNESIENRLQNLEVISRLAVKNDEERTSHQRILDLVFDISAQLTLLTRSASGNLSELIADSTSTNESGNIRVALAHTLSSLVGLVARRGNVASTMPVQTYSIRHLLPYYLISLAEQNGVKLVVDGDAVIRSKELDLVYPLFKLLLLRQVIQLQEGRIDVRLDARAEHEPSQCIVIQSEGVKGPASVVHNYHLIDVARKLAALVGAVVDDAGREAEAPVIRLWLLAE